MEAVHYVIAAGALVWLGLGVYIFRLGCKQKTLALRLRQLELMEGKSHE